MAFAPVYTFQANASAPIGPLYVASANHLTLVPVTITFGATDTYVTGGYQIVLPDQVSEMGFDNVYITKDFDGTSLWRWDGSRSAPKLVAYSAFATELANASAAIQNKVVELILVLKS